MTRSGDGRSCGEQLVEALIDEQLVVVQVQVGVYLVPIEQVVADGELAEQIALTKRRLLPVTRQREKELRLEGGARDDPRRSRQKRILRFVEDHRRVEARSEAIGEQRFSDAGRTLDGDVAEIQG